MNRKEATIVGALLITTFFASAFAAPAIQNIMIVNDPLNVRIVDGTTTIHTTSVDIEVLKLVPGVAYSTNAWGTTVFAYTVSGNPPVFLNFTAAFSFAPSREFVQVDSLIATITFNQANVVSGAAFGGQLNDLGSSTFPMPEIGNAPATVTGTFPAQDLRIGSNTISIGIDLPPNSSMTIYLYEVRLTVEYTFLD